MSDSEGDISDELLELAGVPDRKRKKRQSKSSAKRRKAELEDYSDEDQPESEEDAPVANPYPLEGKYTDEADRERLLGMSEIDREDILAQRLEEMQRIQDKRNLDQMLKDQSRRSKGNGEESVSKAAKRQHAVRGATKEKSRKLDELKARRKAKDEKKRTRTNSPKRDRSSSPMDMETSDDEEEDGQISKYEEQEEKDRKLYDKSSTKDELVTLEDIERIRLPRDALEKYCMTPWFEDYVKGAWVRYLIGQQDGEPVYRMCEVINLGADLVKPYKINNQLIDQELELRHGSSTKRFTMDKVSNAKFTQREFDRMAKSCENDKIKLPSKRQIEKKLAEISKLELQPMTEADVSAMLARKNKLLFKGQSSSSTHERSRLTQARNLAMRRQDYAEVTAIDEQLARLSSSAPVRSEKREETAADILAKVNERNRKANMEAVRRAEIQEHERKRKLLVARRAAGTATPTTPLVKVEGESRPDTPTAKTEEATPRSLSPLLPSSLSAQSDAAKPNTFEASLVASIEIDLGDF